MFALRACLEITAIFCAAEKKNWLLFAAIFLSKRKKEPCRSIVWQGFGGEAGI